MSHRQYQNLSLNDEDGLMGESQFFASSCRVSRRNTTEVRANDSSIFAAVYAMVCFWRIWTSGHGFVRKIMLNLITIYSTSSFLPPVLMMRSVQAGAKLTDRLDQSVIQLALSLLVLSRFLLPYRFIHLDWVRPFRWSWSGYFRCV